MSQVDFIQSKFPESDYNILDIGCGIGTLSFELGKYYKNVLGIDMDSEMIRVAKRKYNNTPKSIEFKQHSMLELNTFIEKNSIDGIVCFGNTLVHLNSTNEIADFLHQSKTVLKPNGKLLLQIVNYDAVLTKKIRELPRIENDEIIFERHYNYQKLKNKIDFNTLLTVKETQQKIKNSIELFPLMKEQLMLLLNKAGFNNCNFYGNFKKELFTVDSPALIVEAS